MFKKTMFKKVIFAGLGLVISILSFIITINAYLSVNMNQTFVFVFFLLGLFSVLACGLYTYYGMRGRKMKGYKGWGYILILIYVIISAIFLIYSIITSFTDIWGKEIFSKFNVISLSQNKSGFSGSFLFGFITTIITEIAFTIYYFVDIVLTIKNILKANKGEIQLN